MLSTAAIANGATTSQALALDGAVTGLVLPAAFTGTAISLLVSVDGTTYAPLYDGAGALVSIVVAQGHAVGLDPTLTAGYSQVKLVSNASEGAARAVGVVSRPV